MSDRAAAALTVAGLVLLVIVAGVLLRPLAPVDETRYLAVSWEMWQSGNYIVPTLNQEIYTHKPPLLFWTINLVWAFTGVSDTAARLVAPLYGLVGILLTGLLARRLWPEDPGIGARSVMAMCGLLIFALSIGLTMFDAMLTTATVAGMLAIVAAARTGRRRWWIALGAALALGVLSKGPVILVHLMPAALLLPLWADRDWPVTWRSALTGSGIAFLTGLVLVGIWLLDAIIMGGPEYREAVLWTQSAGRMANSFAHARPWWFFLSVLPLLLFPWVFVPALWRAGLSRAPWSETGMKLALVWAGGAFLFFSVISGKQLHYLVPELAAVALVIGRLTRDLGAFRLVWAALPLLLFAVVAVVAAAGLIPMGDTEPLLQPRSMLLAWALAIVAVVWAALRLGGLRGGVVLTFGTLLSLNLLIGLTEMRAVYDSRRIAEVIVPFQEAGIAVVGQTYHGEYIFAGRMTHAVDTPALEDLDDWMAAHPDGMIVARPERVTLSWPPAETILFRGSPYGLWKVADAPTEDNS
jgi:4-amino-4-deoxy-L-arabinose transferase-like glycosyltransferase